jgi:hypothetical protein
MATLQRVAIFFAIRPFFANFFTTIVVGDLKRKLLRIQ